MIKYSFTNVIKFMILKLKIYDEKEEPEKILRKMCYYLKTIKLYNYIMQPQSSSYYAHINSF